MIPIPILAKRSCCVKLHGRMKVLYMIQQRLICKSPEDDHYCACIFKYAKEYAAKLRDIATFICTDDKHKISVGEPGYPLASVPRGTRVLVDKINCCK